MNCIVLNKPTKDKTNNFPLSREARPIVNEVLEAHNRRISQAFIEKHKDNGMTEKALRKLSPKVSKHYLLGLINRKENDVMETLATVLEPAKSAEESETNNE